VEPSQLVEHSSGEATKYVDIRANSASLSAFNSIRLRSTDLIVGTMPDYMPNLARIQLLVKA